MAIESPELLEHLFQAVLNESPVTRALYDDAKTSLQHYQSSPVFSSLVDKKLMMGRPELFETLRETYREKIAQLEHAMIALDRDGSLNLDPAPILLPS